MGARQVVIACVLFLSAAACALEPDEILIIANANNEASMRLAHYYARRRNIPTEHILDVQLDRLLKNEIKRDHYDRYLAGPVREMLSRPQYSQKIRSLVTVYGVPYRVGPRGILAEQATALAELESLAGRRKLQLQGLLEKIDHISQSERQPEEPRKPNEMLEEMEEALRRQAQALRARKQNDANASVGKEWIGMHLEFYGGLLGRQKLAAWGLSDLAEQIPISGHLTKAHRLVQRAREEHWNYEKRFTDGYYSAVELVTGLYGVLRALDSDIQAIRGAETGASVDSELSMIRFGNYELYRWQPNELRRRILWLGAQTLMVSRLDGPSEQVVMDLVDKAILAEEAGLKGTAYFDLGYGIGKPAGSEFEQVDQSLRRAGQIVKERTKWDVVMEETKLLFMEGQCPNTALYCGWYSLRNYVDAFDFAPGAIGYHIASWEAVDLRDTESRQWCANMLADGITATLGAVAEPYLVSFPRPDEFFGELIQGKCLVEAYYRSKPFNSWQMLLIGDPLYRPFE